MQRAKVAVITPPLVRMIWHGRHYCNVAPMNTWGAEANSASGKRSVSFPEDPSTFAFNPWEVRVPLLVRVELPDSGQGQVSARATCSVENRPSLHAVLKASHLYQGLRRFESPVAILQAPCSEDSLSYRCKSPLPQSPSLAAYPRRCHLSSMCRLTLH